MMPSPCAPHTTTTDITTGFWTNTLWRKAATRRKSWDRSPAQRRATTCFDTSADPSTRWSLYRACPHPAPRCPHLFHVFLTRLYPSSPLSIRWLNPPIPVVVGRDVVEKSVFGILLPTRQLWAQLLSGESPASSECAPALDPSLSCTATDSVASVSSNATFTDTGKMQDTISATEAQAFISSVLQPCINLMHIDTARKLMTQALACVCAWLMVIFYSSRFIISSAHC